MSKIIKNLNGDKIIIKDEDEKIDSSDEECTSDEKDCKENESSNIPFNGSPLYPKLFLGDSSKHTNNQYPESEYVDDNIHRTYQGLLSFYG